MTPQDLARIVKRVADDLGFEACGITDPAPSPTGDKLDRWLERGYHGEMRYMARQATVRRAPLKAWTDAKSIVVVLHNYYSHDGQKAHGYCVAQYAQGVDYHTVTMTKLDALGMTLTKAAGRGTYRSYVDAGPLPERELAQRAGLGWMAKNTMLIHPGLGSFTFIGCLLTDLELARDQPFEADRCGTCSRCLDACPTDAFPAPHVLDATRCISYLTIEAKSDVPAPLRAAVGDHLFGCDICQDVCPWNVRFAGETGEAAFRPLPEVDWPTPEAILAMDERAFDERFGETAIERAGLSGLQRNARVVLENR
jgi:epoxyqueuosine reductase